MRKFDNKRNAIINKYVSSAQLLFSLLLVVLIFRSLQTKLGLYVLDWSELALVCLAIGSIPIIYLARKTSSQLAFDLIINCLYLVIVTFLLVSEHNSVFKILYLMPVIVMAIKYGFRLSLLFVGIVVLALVIIAFINPGTLLDGDIIVVSCLVFVSWLLGNMTEADKNIRAQLEQLADRDGLTQLFNHRSFYNILSIKFEAAKEGQGTVSLMLIDVDYFKYYNDAYGHQQGDDALKMIASILLDEVKGQGYCARYGGEEFAIIVPHADTIQVTPLAERIRQRIANTEFMGEEIMPSGRITASVGLADYPTHAQSKEQLVQKADEALYKAKFVSRNRVEAYYSVFDELAETLKNDEQELLRSMRTLTMVINAKDKYTYGHSLRVMELAKSMGEKLKLSKVEVQSLMYGALLHDIGKVEIAREVLNKPGALGEQEWQLMKKHPQWGADIVRPLTSLSDVREIILYHHENYDGTGYPTQRKGADIPLGARILRIIDSYDAMTTNRPYHQALSTQQALKELQTQVDRYYDPALVALFTELINNDIKKEVVT